MISVNKSVQSVYSTFTKRGQGRTKADKPGVMNVTVPDPEEFIHSQTEADLFLVPRHCEGTENTLFTLLTFKVQRGQGNNRQLGHCSA